MNNYTKIIFDDSLIGFSDTLLADNFSEIHFQFTDVVGSLRRVKELILKYEEIIDFTRIYFYNANDFINIILNKPLYLPKNVNLFINESCVIGCNFCYNDNSYKKQISFESIKKFLSNFQIRDNINFNIIGKGDPLFHPELLEIINYIKSFGAHITFFSGGKAILFCNFFDKIAKNVDEFNINLSASNREVYNKTHLNTITSQEFTNLEERIKSISTKTNLLFVVMRENVTDLLPYYNFCLKLGVRGLEIKKNLQYLENDILNENTYDKIGRVIRYFLQEKKLNIISNIGLDINQYVTLPSFYKKSESLLDNYLHSQRQSIDIDTMNSLNTCHQFGNSLDLNEDNTVTLCCKKEASTVSSLQYEQSYYTDQKYKDTYDILTKQVPDTCKNCVMPVDRYKNYLKYQFIDKL